MAVLHGSYGEPGVLLSLGGGSLYVSRYLFAGYVSCGMRRARVVLRQDNI